MSLRRVNSANNRAWDRSRFDPQDNEPLGPLANLLDLMLVFACGLIAALIAMSKNVDAHFNSSRTSAAAQQSGSAIKIVEQGKELPQLPGQGRSAGEGFEPVGQVYRDPKTGKLILIGD